MWDFLTEHWRDGVEIIILAALAYHGYLFFRATRGARILTGLMVLLLSLALISLLLELSVISSLLQRFSVFLAIALVIVALLLAANFQSIRLAAIVQGVYKRGLDGNASSETAKQYGNRARVLADLAWSLVKNGA